MSQPVQQPVVYDSGFGGFKVDTGSYPDLLGHLFSEFLKAQTEQQKPLPAKKAKEFALAFVEFARQYLDTNPPQSLTYVGSGIAIKFQNGITVTFHTKDATVVSHRNEAIAVTRTRSQPGQHGISDTASIAITTGQTKVQDARTQDQPPNQEPRPAKNPRKRKR